MTMTSNEEEPYGPEGLEPDIVKKLVPEPSEPAVPAIVLEGLIGRSARGDEYWRLYFTTNLNEYAEFREEDVLHREPSAKEHHPFVGLEFTKLWVKRDAEVMYTRIVSPSQVQASFLAGDLATGSTAEAGTPASTLGAGAGVPPITPTESVWCPPTYGPGCGSWFKRCR
jgi:hypothetical protein